MAICIGIDVAKHTLEWTAGTEGKIQHTRNEPRPIAALVRRMVAVRGAGPVFGMFWAVRRPLAKRASMSVGASPDSSGIGGR